MLGEKKGNQLDKTQSQKIQKPCTYDFFPMARAAFIGIDYFDLDEDSASTGYASKIRPIGEDEVGI